MNLLTVLLSESGLFCLALLYLYIHQVSNKHQGGFNLPILKFPQLTWMKKLAKDAAVIWKAQEPEFFTSPDGNILYLSQKLTAAWTKEQVLLFMLAHKAEFTSSLKERDPIVFEVFNTLLDKVNQSTVTIRFGKLLILPAFQKTLAVWQVALLDTTTKEEAITKEV